MASDSPDGFSAREAITFLETSDLSLAISRDDDGGIHSFVDAGFVQQRHVVDHHSVRVFSCCLFGKSHLFAGNTGVDDAFKPTPLGLISENNSSQFPAIEGAVRIEDGPAEGFHNLSPSRFAWLHDIVGQLVGIDDDCAALLEHLGNGALAGRDAACEANENHGEEDNMRVPASQPSLIDFWLGRLV